MATTQIDGGRQIKAATITNAEIATGASIALSKLAESVIQADGGQAFTADQSLGGFKLTSVGTPTSDTDAATKGYVDALSQGLSPKDSVRVATTVAGTLATSFENGDTIDGVVLVTGDRILIKDQAAGAENGIYTVNASGTPTRATDANTADKINSAYTFVSEGSSNADAGFVLTTDAPITLGTTALSFSQFSGAGNISAGAGLTKTGNTIDVIGTANRIVVSADAVDIGTDVVTLTGSQTLTNKTLTSPVINTPTGIVKGDVGLGNVDNTSDATKNAASVTLTNKTIALGSNTVSGTLAQFNSAVTDADLVSLTGSETLTNKTLTSPVISTITNTGTLTLPTSTGTLALTSQITGTNSGTNTGDQTSIVGITGTKAQFDTAVTDGNFLYSGDITQYTDEMAQDAVGAMVDSTLVYTDGTPLLSRAALTGHVTASAGSNALVLGSFTKAQLDTAVSDGNVLYVGDITQGLVAANFVTRETPSGAVNGSNAVYTTANTITAGSEEVFLNGLLQDGGGKDYTFSAGNTITFVSAPASGDRIRVNYRKP